MALDKLSQDLAASNEQLDRQALAWLLHARSTLISCLAASLAVVAWCARTVDCWLHAAGAA